LDVDKCKEEEEEDDGDEEEEDRGGVVVARPPQPRHRSKKKRAGKMVVPTIRVTSLEQAMQAALEATSSPCKVGNVYLHLGNSTTLLEYSTTKILRTVGRC
jgi:hypothetical protein